MKQEMPAYCISIRMKITLPSFFFYHGATAPSGPGPPRCQGFTLRHTTLGRTPLDAWPARCRDLYM